FQTEQTEARRAPTGAAAITPAATARVPATSITVRIAAALITALFATLILTALPRPAPRWHTNRLRTDVVAVLLDLFFLGFAFALVAVRIANAGGSLTNFGFRFAAFAGINAARFFTPTTAFARLGRQVRCEEQRRYQQGQGYLLHGNRPPRNG
ncbi:MAG: hypothetical protein RID07_14875, partial [Lacipirellulaceae bacterium]